MLVSSRPAIFEHMCQENAGQRSRKIGEGDRIVMNRKHFFRATVMFLLTGLVVIGLASCKLPASKGPQTTSEATNSFPLPGTTEQSSGVTVSIFATQTAQALHPIIVPTSIPPATSAAPSQEATSVPTEPSPTEVTQEPGAPITYVTATPGGPPATYKLAAGEYPFCIARRFDVNQEELLNLNGLTVDSLLSPGQELKIPQTGNPFEGDRSLHEHPTTYTVLAGDTLNRIACYFGDVSPDMIALQNDLELNADLTVGEKLIIP